MRAVLQRVREASVHVRDVGEGGPPAVGSGSLADLHARSPDPHAGGPAPPARPCPSTGDGWQEAVRIGPGLLVLVGFAGGESAEDLEWLCGKVLDLRLFRGSPQATGSASAGEFDRSVTEVGGEVLVVSQFTLLAGVRKGRRPDFVAAAPADRAFQLYEDLLRRLEARYDRIRRGVFGAEMRVALVNDGPATFVLERG